HVAAAVTRGGRLAVRRTGSRSRRGRIVAASRGHDPASCPRYRCRLPPGAGSLSGGSLSGELPHRLRAGAAAAAVDPVGAVRAETGLLGQQHVRLELTRTARGRAVTAQPPVRGPLVEGRAAAHGLGDALATGQLPLLGPALVLLAPA